MHDADTCYVHKEPENCPDRGMSAATVVPLADRFSRPYGFLMHRISQFSQRQHDVADRRRSVG
jgi:hypothetical protein